MDIRMPIMDGIQATRLTCQEFPTAIILILTTHDDEAVLASARQAGAKRHLSKDASREELLSAVHEVVQG